MSDIRKSMEEFDKLEAESRIVSGKIIEDLNKIKNEDARDGYIHSLISWLIGVDRTNASSILQAREDARDIWCQHNEKFLFKDLFD